MIKRYHEPLGDPEHKQDPLPDNWRELAARAGSMPKNFGVVEHKKLYRSAIVWPSQVEGLHANYGINHFITLMDGDWLLDHYARQDITIHQFPFFQRRELTLKRVKDIVEVINTLDSPSIVSCLKGSVRTGMVVAGYEIINGRKSNLVARLESGLYWNFNGSAHREIKDYLP